MCLNSLGELSVTKFAVEPVSLNLHILIGPKLILPQVWYLPGVAERFGIGKLLQLLCMRANSMY